MAKKKTSKRASKAASSTSAKVSKSQAIRDFKGANPSAKPKQISEDLNAQGFDVSPGYVSTILSTSKNKKPGRKRGRPKGSKNGAGKAASAGGRKAMGSADKDLSAQSLLRVKELVSELGGVSQARAALDTLEQLMG